MEWKNLVSYQIFCYYLLLFYHSIIVYVKLLPNMYLSMEKIQKSEQFEV